MNKEKNEISFRSQRIFEMLHLHEERLGSIYDSKNHRKTSIICINGGYGTGKTELAKCVLNSLKKNPKRYPEGKKYKPILVDFDQFPPGAEISYFIIEQSKKIRYSFSRLVLVFFTAFLVGSIILNMVAFWQNILNTAAFWQNILNAVAFWQNILNIIAALCSFVAIIYYIPHEIIYRINLTRIAREKIRDRNRVYLYDNLDRCGDKDIEELFRFLGLMRANPDSVYTILVFMDLDRYMATHKKSRDEIDQVFTLVYSFRKEVIPPFDTSTKELKRRKMKFLSKFFDKRDDKTMEILSELVRLYDVGYKQRQSIEQVFYQVIYDTKIKEKNHRIITLLLVFSLRKSCKIERLLANILNGRLLFEEKKRGSSQDQYITELKSLCDEFFNLFPDAITSSTTFCYRTIILSILYLAFIHTNEAIIAKGEREIEFKNIIPESIAKGQQIDIIVNNNKFTSTPCLLYKIMHSIVKFSPQCAENK